MDSGNIGEKFIHCELLRTGLEHVYLANSSNQEEWDLAYFKQNEDEDRYRLIKLQVKTKDWKNRRKSTTINGNFKSGFHFLIIVLLNYSEQEPYLVYVIPKEKLKEKKKGNKYKLFDATDNTILFTNKTITLNLFDKFKSNFDKNYNWNVFISCLKNM